MKAKTIHIDRNGRISIPAIVREKLNIRPGDELSFELKDDEIRISTYKSHLDKARKILEKYGTSDLQSELQKMRDEDAHKER